MENNSEPVWIMFITDTETRDKLLKYGSGSQWEVDPSTAAALNCCDWRIVQQPQY